MIDLLKEGEKYEYRKKLNQSYDGVGDGVEASRGGWSFQSIDSDSFEAHVEKSVPDYSIGHKYIRPF